jgi:AAA domain
MSKSLPLIGLERIMDEELPAPDWLVEPLISNGSRVVVYGAWGSYKSWGLLDLGLHLATGQAWLGKFPISSARRVLYVDEEMSQRVLRRRIKRLALGMGPITDRSMFRALSRHGVRLNPHGTTLLLDGLKTTAFDPEVVIIETLRRVFEGNENEAKDVAEFWRGVEPIVQPGKTLIISHHMRKPSPNGSNPTRHQASGSTDIMAGVDDALAFVRRGKDAFTIEHVKCRDGEEVDPFLVGLDEDGDSVTLRHEGTKAQALAQAGKAAQAEQQIEAYLAESPDHAATTGEILAHLDSLGIAKRTGEDALASMKKSVRLEPLGKGRCRLAV